MAEPDEVVADDAGGGCSGGGGGSGGGGRAVGGEEAVLPRRRFPWNDPPNYGRLDDRFSVEVHHGGFFCGSGQNRAYLDEKIDTFDELDRRTFGCLFIDKMVNDLGYTMNDHRIRVYWCRPGCSINDGLVAIYFEKHADLMIRAAIEEKTLAVYVDHVGVIEKQRWDEDMQLHSVKLPAVLSPRKVPGKHKGAEQFTEVVDGLQDEEDVVQRKKQPECSDSDKDWDIVDSDYDLEEKDDEEYKKNVDAEVKDAMFDKGKKPVEIHLDIDVADDQDLELPEQEKDKSVITYKWKKFNKLTDMSNPIFKIGQIFSNVKELRQAISMYCVKERVQLHKIRNNSIRFEAQCSKLGCPWYIIATKDSRTECFAVKHFIEKHECERVWEVKELTAPMLAQEYKAEIRDDEKMSLKAFATKVQKQFNMEPNRFKLARAKLAALKQIRGDEIAQYNQLWDYGQEVRTQNLGSRFILKTLGPIFSCLYMCLDACKRGWLKGCRPVIFIDGTHIKTKFGGQLLTALGIDGNDCIYPIAWAIVEVECYSSWMWFLTTLKNDLNIVNTSPFTIMSDKQKGLIKAVMELFPHSEHRFCVRHLYSNMNQLHKGETVKNHLWACARASNIPRWEKNMEAFKTDCLDAHAWLEEMPSNTWARAFFSEFPKCDILLNNTCEVFNRMILGARELPVLSMLEDIYGQLMTRMYNKNKEALEDWTGQICPKIKSKLNKVVDWAANYTAKPAGKGVFKVTRDEVTYIVELNSRSCSCRRWQLTGIPCTHVCACLRHERIKPEQMVSKCYSIHNYMKAYGNMIRPIRDKSEWTKLNGAEVKPPYYEKVVGRPKKSRRKNPEETHDGTRLSKAGVMIHCGHCGAEGHNRKGCPRLKEIAAAEAAAQAHAAAQDAAQAHATAEEEAASEQATAQDDEPRPRRQKRRSVHEQVSIPNCTRGPTTEDEFGDADVPEMMEHIDTVELDPTLDPSKLHDSMINALNCEVPTMIFDDPDPFPEESEFVAHYRESVPAATTRVTTATSRGRAILRGSRGRARGRGVRARGRGGRTARTAATNPGTRGESSAGNAARGRGIGRGEWLLFGDGGVDGAVEIDASQAAPDPMSQS